MKLSKRIAQVNPSSTLQITAKAKRLAASGVDVVGFGAGEPDADTPVSIKQKAIEAITEGFTKYTPSTGIIELKEAICKKFKQDNSLSYEPSQIVVSCGAKHALFNSILALCDEGDEVIIPSPYWVSYPEMVKVSGAKAVFLKTRQENDFKFTEKELLSAVSKNTKLLILNSPSNPTGCVYTKQELLKIADIAKAHDFYIISDEIYEKLLYDGAEHVSIASLNEDAYKRTISVNGVSKTYSMTGWRIGYLAGPKDFTAVVSALQDHSTSNPASISQKAALEALRGDEKFVADMREKFLQRRDIMISRLSAIKGLNPYKPKGAFYVFCDVSGTGLSGSEFTERLLDKMYVAVIPGEGFGWPTHIRLSFATSLENIKKGLERIKNFVGAL
ncbi:MAG: pyridoxal phosphate-dependent aminotransferase [Candidatus Omnitrophota bacterium]